MEDIYITSLKLGVNVYIDISTIKSIANMCLAREGVGNIRLKYMGRHGVGNEIEGSVTFIRDVRGEVTTKLVVAGFWQDIWHRIGRGGPGWKGLWFPHVD